MKMILVPLGGGASGDKGESRLDAAFAIARRFNSHVEVLHVRPDPSDVLRAMSLKLPGSLRQSVSEVAQSEAAAASERARALFQSCCERHRVTVQDKPPMAEGVSAAWLEMQGRESIAIAQRGRLTDLIVVDRSLQESPAPPVLEAALMETGKPVLVLPPPDRRPAPEAIGRNVVIGWNGSIVAAKAVAAARHFLITASKVTALSLKEDKTKPSRVGVDDLIDHLAWHGVTADSRVFEAKRGDIGDSLLAAARELEADLLVLGGYGTSMTREIIRGGVTRHMLAHAEIPLLMAH
ncbi:MAG: universal stress protein [Kiloniellales bacterium]